MIDISARSQGRLLPWNKQHDVKITLLMATVLFVFVYLSPDILVSVDTGESGVLWHRFGGTVMDRTYPECLHILYPWDKMYVYDTRMQARTDSVSVQIADGRVVSAVVTTHFALRTEKLPLFHQRIGPNYVDILLLPEVVGALRQVLGVAPTDTIRASFDAGFEQEVDLAVRNRIGKDFLDFHGLMIRKLTIQEHIVR